MIATALELYNSLEFWNKRQKEQTQYLTGLYMRVSAQSLSMDRFYELMDNATLIKIFCLKRIEELK